MTWEEKNRRARLMSPLLKQLTEIAIGVCSKSNNPNISIGQIQDAIKPHLNDVLANQKESFMELASMGITMVISDFIKHEIAKHGSRGGDISITE